MLYGILFTHRNSPGEVRERIYKFWEETLEKDLPGIKEKVLLVTCYRVELYLRVDKNKKEVIKNIIPPVLLKYPEIVNSPSRIFEHIVIVGTGADSPAIGEPEVLGQVKDAYEKAKEKGWVSKYLVRAFERAIFTAKKIREETKLQFGSMSIPRIVSLYLKDFSREYKNIRCLIVGTGEMGISISKYLYQERIPFAIATKSEERAKFLKEHAKLDTIVYTSETLPLYVPHFTAVIFATNTEEYLLKPEHLKSKDNPKIIIDLGFPRNVDPEVRNLNKIKFHQIDEFKKIIEERVKEKENLLSYVKFRAKRESEKFERWIKKEEEILKIFEFVDLKTDKILKGYEDNGKLRKILEKMKKFYLYPTLKSLRSGKPIEEIIKNWIK